MNPSSVSTLAQHVILERRVKSETYGTWRDQEEGARSPLLIHTLIHPLVYVYLVNQVSKYSLGSSCALRSPAVSPEPALAMVPSCIPRDSGDTLASWKALVVGSRQTGLKPSSATSGGCDFGKSCLLRFESPSVKWAMSHHPAVVDAKIK